MSDKSYFKQPFFSIIIPIHLLQKTIKAFPDKTITIGGGALSVFSRKIIERLPQTGVIGVIGEGEEALLAIADGRDLKGHRVIYRENGSIISGEDQVQSNL